MPVGPSVDGKGWVNINNKCKCGHGMPLPESHGKYCSECGTRQPTWEEFPQFPGVRKPNVPLVVSDVVKETLRPDTVTVEVHYTSQFTMTIVVDCRRDGTVKELVEAAIEDIEPGTGEYVDDSWEVRSHELVEAREDSITEFIPPLGEPYQLPDTRHRIGEWFYSTRHCTWVLSVAKDNLSEKMPVWVLDSTHVPEEEDAPGP